MWHASAPSRLAQSVWHARPSGHSSSGLEHSWHFAVFSATSSAVVSHQPLLPGGAMKMHSSCALSSEHLVDASSEHHASAWHALPSGQSSPVGLEHRWHFALPRATSSVVVSHQPSVNGGGGGGDGYEVGGRYEPSPGLSPGVMPGVSVPPGTSVPALLSGSPFGPWQTTTTAPASRPRSTAPPGPMCREPRALFGGRLGCPRRPRGTAAHHTGTSREKSGRWRARPTSGARRPRRRRVSSANTRRLTRFSARSPTLQTSPRPPRSRRRPLHRARTHCLSRCPTSSWRRADCRRSSSRRCCSAAIGTSVSCPPRRLPGAASFSATVPASARAVRSAVSSLTLSRAAGRGTYGSRHRPTCSSTPCATCATSAATSPSTMAVRRLTVARARWATIRRGPAPPPPAPPPSLPPPPSPSSPARACARAHPPTHHHHHHRHARRERHAASTRAGHRLRRCLLHVRHTRLRHVSTARARLVAPRAAGAMVLLAAPPHRHVSWLITPPLGRCGGESFDGCLLFDECHKAKHWTGAAETSSKAKPPLPCHRISLPQ